MRYTSVRVVEFRARNDKLISGISKLLIELAPSCNGNPCDGIVLVGLRSGFLNLSSRQLAIAVQHVPPITAQCHAWGTFGGLVLHNGAHRWCGFLGVLLPVGRAGPAGVA